MTTVAIAGSRSPARLSRPAVLTGAALTIASAAIHLHLWFDGYRHVPDIGRLFLAQAIAGIGVAAAAVAMPRRIAAAAGAVYLAATSAGLLLSATVGIFNFHDGLDSPYAGVSLAVQGAGIALFALVALLADERRPRDGGQTSP
ncbi:MAG: hypothetical protein JO265_12275 [Acidimicrobiia bacterium]|nr:hypothetical protein [Acidimicrobiia bacterium]